MIAMRKNSVETTCHRITRTDLGKRKCAKQADDCTHYPRHKKYLGDICFLRHLHRGAKDAHANYQAHHNHGEIKLAELRFYRQTKGLKCVSDKLIKIKACQNQMLVARQN